MPNWRKGCDGASSWTSWTSCWWPTVSACAALSQSVEEIENGVEVSESESENGVEVSESESENGSQFAGVPPSTWTCHLD